VVRSACVCTVISVWSRPQGWKVRSAGRVPSTLEGLAALKESLLASDGWHRGDGFLWEVARILEPFVQRVLVVSSDDTGISKRTRQDGQA